MNQRLIVASLMASMSVACGGGGSSGGSGGKMGSTGGAGPGTGGSGAGTGGVTGSGGSTPGSGGASTGSGGASGGSSAGTGGRGGASTGTGGRGGASTGTGGTPAGSGGSGTGTGGRANAGGTAGSNTGGAAATGGAGGTVAATGSVLERNNSPSRNGHFVQPLLTKAAAATMMPDAAFNSAATFSGNVAASPLFLDGPNGSGLFFIPTGGGDVFARKENGTSQWMRNIGAPATGNIGCSGISTTAPLGILSTPVIDEKSRTIYVAGITGNAQGVTAQIASAINVDDGTVRSGWPVDVSTAASFDPKIHNQRSALSLLNGILYVPYAGYIGDCGSYRGRVIAINTATPTTVGQWSTSDAGGGIWAPGGLASDGTGVFATTGNYVPLGSAPAAHGDSEQVTKITGMGTKADFFYPTTWATMDRDDADFGSVNPIFVTVPGAAPSRIIVALAKDGLGYLLDADQLRGSSSGSAAGGQKVMFRLGSGMSLSAPPRPTERPWGRTWLCR